MEIKRIFLQFKRNFDRIILTVTVFALIIFSLKYISLLKRRPLYFAEKELYELAGISWREKVSYRDENAFKDLIDKKANFILGIKPLVSYERLIQRNPFALLRDLIVEPFSIKPEFVKIDIGDKVTYQTFNGIGPYQWRCEPEERGVFEENLFKAKTNGQGKTIAIDARGHEALAALEVAIKFAPVKPPEEINLRYKGIMIITTPSGSEEVMASIEDTITKRLFFKKNGEKIHRFTVRQMTQEELILFDESKGEEIKLICK